MLRKLKALYMLWKDPKLEYMADYDVLVRLARRCAYDFCHAASELELYASYSTREPYTNWYERANRWTAVFAKGNPGKDYRINIVLENASLQQAIVDCIKTLRDNNIEVPHSAIKMEPLPF